MMVLTVPGMRKIRKRCQACAGEPVPADLPPLVERTPTPVTPMAHILTGPEALPFDYKTAQTGEREPGCDDE